MVVKASTVNLGSSGGSAILVSVVMPVYNGERYVAEAVESILGQTLSSFEFIIVDDGSTDRTPEILARYAAQDSRIVIVTQPNMGQPAALNRALSLAKSDWVAIIDHDDVSLPQRLERQLESVAENPATRLLGSFAIMIDGVGRPFGMRRNGPTTVAEFEHIRRSDGWVSLVHPSVIMHRPTALGLGGYRAEFGMTADSELWSRFADKHLVLSLPEPLVCYRLHGKNMSIERFFEGQEMLRWTAARQHARWHGKPEPTLEESRRASNGLLGLGRLNLLRHDRVLYLIWQARIAWHAGRRTRAAALFVAAAALGPDWIGGRMIDRTTGRRARLTRSDFPLPWTPARSPR